MARDYAKNKQGKRKTGGGKGGRRVADRKPANSKTASLKAFLAGVVTGLFLAFLLYLGSIGGSEITTPENEAVAAPEAPPKPRFEFFNRLAEPAVDPAQDYEPVEPAADVVNPAAPTAERFIVQAGSFRQRDDAEQRRAQLILLGLVPIIEKSSSDNRPLYRVYLGPFNNRSEANRARGLTANEGIETLLLKRG